MTTLAKDIMTSEFDVIKKNDLVVDAIKKILKTKERKSGYKNESLIVINEFKDLEGIVTMFDIFYHLRPTFFNYGFQEINFEWKEEIEKLIKNIGVKKVEEIMSRNVVTIKPNDKILAVIDIMVKNKYRRLPVTENSKIMGIIYFSDLYKYLFSNYKT